DQVPPASPDNIYIYIYIAAIYSRHWHATLHPTTRRPHRTTPHNPTHKFSRHQGIYYVVLGKRPDAKFLVNFPSGHAMSSCRVFLSGLLSSRARLRFAGLFILPNPNCSALPTTLFANPQHRKTIGTSTQPLAQWNPN